MTKIAFNARKDPLLRPRTADKPTLSDVRAPDATDSAPTAARADPANGLPDTARDSSNSDIARASASRKQLRAAPRTSRPGESTPEPGALSNAIPGINAPERPSGRDGRGKARATPQRAPSSLDSNGRQTRVRRVQTSVSLPPAMWDTLDALGTHAGVSAGELLAAILERAVPESAADALELLERLLPTIAPDEGLHEERNYRLALELRSRLDTLTQALGRPAGPRRSLLIRAIAASAMPQGPDYARELVTAVRMGAMRAAVKASATG